jgi:hypothetical protein
LIESEASAQHSRLVEQVLSGKSPELQELAAAGMLPLPPLELVTLQVSLAQIADKRVAEQAADTLESTEPARLAQIIRDGLPADALAWIAQHRDHPLVLEAVVSRNDAQPELLLHLASTLSEELQEMLLLRQDAIVETPEILEALERNPRLSSYSRRRIAEYRRHLLREEPAEVVEVEEVEAPEPDEIDLITQEEIDEAIEEAREEPPVGEVDEITGLSESQLRTLPLPIRLKLSRRAPRALRGILVRDTNPSVAVSVLENNPMSESEVEQVARSRAVVHEVLAAIARNRSWSRKYPITLALVKNPRTPVGTAIRLAPRLSVRDLRAIGKDRNVANAVRSAAVRLYKVKLS